MNNKCQRLNDVGHCDPSIITVAISNTDMLSFYKLKYCCTPSVVILHVRGDIKIVSQWLLPTGNVTAVCGCFHVDNYQIVKTIIIIIY